MLQDVWPQVEARLHRIAAARGVPADDRDDLVQEVAARALAAKVTFESAEDLLPWAAAVLRRAHVDNHRHSERFELRPDMTKGGGHPGEAALSSDVACTVVARLDLAAISEVVASWEPDARRALFADTSAAGSKPSAFYVRRHRLRARLLEVIDGIGGGWVGVRRLEAMTSEALAPVAVHAPIAAAACLTVALAIGGGTAMPADDGASPARPSEHATRLSAAKAAAFGAAGTSPRAGGHAWPVDRNRTSSGQQQPPTDASGAPAPYGSRTFRSPVEHHAEVEAAGQRPSAEVTNRDDDHPPLVCTGGELMPSMCMDSPVYPRDHLPLPSG